jgi:hypothetical protein
MPLFLLFSQNFGYTQPETEEKPVKNEDLGYGVELGLFQVICTPLTSFWPLRG